MDTQSNSRSLSSAESRIVLGLSEEGRRELTRRDAIERFALSAKSADDILRSLVRKGWLVRAGHGKYLLIPPDWGATPLGESNTLALASQLTEDGYMAFSTAAAHWGLTTQLRSVIWIVTRTHARDRRINDSQVCFVRLPANAMFATERVDVYGYAVPMSDREKTVLDCIQYPERAGGLSETSAILAKAARNWKWDKAIDYLERLGNIALIQKVGYLCDAAHLALPGPLRARLHKRIKSSSRTYLVPRARGTAAPRFDGEWGVVVNVEPNSLFKI